MIATALAVAFSSCFKPSTGITSVRFLKGTALQSLTCSAGLQRIPVIELW